MKKIKVLNLTDMEYNGEQIEELARDLQEFESVDYSGLSDNGGDPDGTCWLLWEIDPNADDIKRAVAKGAVICDAYLVDGYSSTVRDELEFDGDWSGVQIEGEAVFLEKKDAELAEKFINEKNA